MIDTQRERIEFGKHLRLWAKECIHPSFTDEFCDGCGVLKKVIFKKMANFNAAIKTVFAHEGGFVNNPIDRGGPTNFGITQPTLEAYLSRHQKPFYSVSQLTQADAGAIYKELFWDPLQLDTITSQKLATVLLDLSVLRGVPATVKVLQIALRSLPMDGKFGPATAMALQAADKSNPTSLALDIVLHTQYLLADFAVEQPAQIVFLDGWIGRTQELIRLVFA